MNMLNVYYGTLTSLLAPVVETKFAKFFALFFYFFRHIQSDCSKSVNHYCRLTVVKQQFLIFTQFCNALLTWKLQTEFNFSQRRLLSVFFLVFQTWFYDGPVLMTESDTLLFHIKAVITMIL